MKKLFIGILIFLLVLVALALILGIWLGFLSSFRIVFGIVFVIFIPGFVWSYVFFASADKTLISNADTTLIKGSDEKDDSIDWIERITLSIALSLALVPLTIFFLNKIGLRINLINVVIEIFGIILVGLIIIMIKLKTKAKKIRN